jgi:hypothetical protein
MTGQVPKRGKFLRRHDCVFLGGFLQDLEGEERFVWVDKARRAVVLPCGGIGFRGKEKKRSTVRPGESLIFVDRVTPRRLRVHRFAYVQANSPVDIALLRLEANGHKCSAC